MRTRWTEERLTEAELEDLSALANSMGAKSGRDSGDDLYARRICAVCNSSTPIPERQGVNYTNEKCFVHIEPCSRLVRHFHRDYRRSERGRKVLSREAIRKAALCVHEMAILSQAPRLAELDTQLASFAHECEEE